MRVALYARVSTDEAHELQDPETQLLPLREWCRANGHDAVQEFVDHASGKSAAGRRRFLEMIGEAESKGRRFDAVAVLRLDRFMRDSVEGMAYAKRLQAANCGLILVKDDILGHVDTSTPLGEFFLTIIFAIGQLERRTINERTREGIARFKRQQGWWANGKNRRKDVNVGLAGELLKVMSLSEASRFLKVPRSTLRDHLKSAGVPIPTAPPCRDTSPSTDAPPSNSIEGEGR